MKEFAQRVSFVQLGQEINRKDCRSIKEWLNEKNIPFRKERGEYYVFRWHIDFSTALDIADDLRKRFPLNWFNVFETVCSDKVMLKAVFEIMPPEPSRKKDGKGNNGRTFFE